MWLKGKVCVDFFVNYFFLDSMVEMNISSSARNPKEVFRKRKREKKNKNEEGVFSTPVPSWDEQKSIK